MSPPLVVVVVALVAGAVVGGAVLAARRLLLVTTVDGASMEPTLCSGERVLVRRTRRARRGEVVLMRFPDRPGRPPDPQLLLKRVVAVTGDRVPGDWASPDLRAIGGAEVPPGYAVVLGDNRPVSWDSRHFGYVARERVLGVMVRPLRR